MCAWYCTLPDEGVPDDDELEILFAMLSPRHVHPDNPQRQLL
jgi:hypothetical protein